MTSLWFAGAENPAHISLFALHEIDRLAVNVGSLKRNYQSRFKGLNVSHDYEWIAWTDSLASLDDLLEVIALVGKRPAYVLGPDDWSSHPQYLPVWNGEASLPVSDAVDKGMFVTDRAFKDKALRARALSAKRPGNVLGAITGSPNNIERFDMVINTSWWNPSQYGETHVWDGTSMKRYASNKKDEMRSFHAKDIERLGVSSNAVMHDDIDAVMDLTFKSWMAFGEVLEAPPMSMHDDGEFSLAPIEATQVINPDSSGAGITLPVPASNRFQGGQLLPSMGILRETIVDDDGAISTGLPIVTSVSESVRQCSNCYLSAACPAFNPAASCAYSIPVEIKTKEQLSKVLQAVVEIQTQRVLQMRFAEEITGQELDAMTGIEMDRLFKMVERMKHIQTTSEGFKVLIESTGADAPQAAGGILSKLFGASVGAAASGRTEAPAPVLDAVEDAVEVQP